MITNTDITLFKNEAVLAHRDVLASKHNKEPNELLVSDLTTRDALMYGYDQEIVLVEVHQYNEQPTRFCSHIVDITYDGMTFQAGGDLLGISNIVSSTAIQEQNITVTMSGLDPIIAGYLVDGQLRGTVRIWSAFTKISEKTEVLVAKKQFDGIIDQTSHKVNRVSATVSIKTSTRFNQLHMPIGKRPTDSIHQEIYPGDEIFKYTAREDKSLDWKRNDLDD